MHHVLFDGLNRKPKMKILCTRNGSKLNISIFSNLEVNLKRLEKTAASLTSARTPVRWNACRRPWATNRFELTKTKLTIARSN